MKIFCISDTEANPEQLEEWLKICKKDLNSSDRVFHLGDGIINIKKLLSKYKVTYIKGNHDSIEKNLLQERNMNINKVNLYLFHGRRKNIIAEKINIYTNYVKKNLGIRPSLENYYNQLFRQYQGKYDIVLYGHMHSPRIDKKQNTIFFCPGSFSQKSSIKKPTYGILEISKNQEVKINIFTVQKNNVTPVQFYNTSFKLKVCKLF